MRKYLLLLLCFYTFFFAQSSNDEWVTYLENEKIKIEYQYIDCNYKEKNLARSGGFNTEYVMLKITNTHNSKIYVDWNLEVWYDNVCYTCEQESTENRINPIELNTNEILTGSCITTSGSLRIFSKFTEDLEAMPGVSKITKLTKFELNDINIQYE